MLIGGMTKQGELLGQIAPKLDQLRRASQGVEAIFLKTLISEMRQASPQDSLSGDSFGSDIYNDMFDQALAEGVGQRDALGIGKIVYDQMSRAVIAQEKTQLLLQAAKQQTENQG